MANEEQHEFWNESGGDSWVAFTPMLDTMMTEVTERLLSLATPRPGQSALDVGCGGGQTSRQVARAVGPRGRVLGLDLSRSLLQLAHRTAGQDYPQLSFRRGDAQTFEFDERVFDLAVSRFGIMFFEDPVAGLSNLRRGLDDHGRLTFACWAPCDRNPLFAAARRIAEEHLGPPETTPGTPRAPGPFAFDDETYVDDLLGRAGFSSRTLHREHPGLHMQSVERGVEMMSNLGPAARRMAEVEASPTQRTAIERSLGEFLRTRESPDGTVVLSSDVFFWVAEAGRRD